MTGPAKRLQPVHGKRTDFVSKSQNDCRACRDDGATASLYDHVLMPFCGRAAPDASTIGLSVALIIPASRCSAAARPADPASRPAPGTLSPRTKTTHLGRARVTRDTVAEERVVRVVQHRLRLVPTLSAAFTPAAAHNSRTPQKGGGEGGRPVGRGWRHITPSSRTRQGW